MASGDTPPAGCIPSYPNTFSVYPPCLCVPVVNARHQEELTEAMTPNERYSVHYRISGPSLDVDALIAAARPLGAHDVWHRGDVLEHGRRARTSGVQIEIVDHHDVADVLEAIDAFLETEAGFLAAVARIATDEAESVLACALWVYADEPVSLAILPETLRRLADRGVMLEVSGFPRDGDD